MLLRGCRGVLEDFRVVARVFKWFQGCYRAFRGFQWFSGVFREVLKLLQGIFYLFPEVSEAFQKFSKGFQGRIRRFKGPFRELQGCSTEI